MKKISALFIHIAKTTVFLAVSSLLITGCAYFAEPMNHALELRNKKEYGQSTEQLDTIINSDSPASIKAQAFMLRGQNYKNLRQYRHAYRDLQVAWKVSCAISEDTKTEQFSPSKACVETIPALIKATKPFTSDFAAIMATQDAAAVIKKDFPDLPR